MYCNSTALRRWWTSARWRDGSVSGEPAIHARPTDLQSRVRAESLGQAEGPLAARIRRLQERHTCPHDFGWRATAQVGVGGRSCNRESVAAGNAAALSLAWCL